MLGTMSRRNRELVEFFICYKLSQKNYPSSLLWPDDAGDAKATGGAKGGADAPAFNGSPADGRNGGGPVAGSGDLDAVKAALRDSADEFEVLYAQAFSSLSSQLDITPDAAYHSFKRVMDEVFEGGVNWGRVVGLFAFGGVLCVECAEKDLSHLVPRVADWMSTYLDEHIAPWITSAGGWVSGGGGAKPHLENLHMRVFSFIKLR